MSLAFALVHSLAPPAFFAFWAASVAWTVSDARRRWPGRERIAAALAVACPLAGAALYALLRPSEDPLEERERNVWRKFLEAELDPGERCLACLTPLRPEFRCCPGCGDSLRHDCRGCGRPVRVGWAACPSCLTPVLEPLGAAA